MPYSGPTNYSNVVFSRPGLRGAVMAAQLHVKDIRLLQVFCEVTDAGGISAAQETLGMTQSNISVLVADLETRLGVTLCQ